VKQQIKGFVSGVMVSGLLIGSIAYASEPTQVHVFFKDLKYMIDGVEKQAGKGETGLIYEGKSYVPLRFISEALGKKVEWDQENQTIWIGMRDGRINYLADIEYARADGIAAENAFFNNVLHVAGTMYASNGIKVKLPEVDLNHNNTSEFGSIEYNLDKQYARLTGKVGIDDRTKNSDARGTFIIYGDGEEIFKKDELRGGDHPIDIDIDLRQISKLKLYFEKEGVDKLTIDFVDVQLIQ